MALGLAANGRLGAAAQDAAAIVEDCRLPLPGLGADIETLADTRPNDTPSKRLRVSVFLERRSLSQVGFGVEIEGLAHRAVSNYRDFAVGGVMSGIASRLLRR